MRSRSLGACLFVLLGTSAPRVQAEAVSAAELDRWIPGLLRASGVPGLSLAIVRDGKIALVRAYGIKDATTGAPVRPETIFEAASLSKPVFAYAVLLLARGGQIDLDTPLTAYAGASALPEDPRRERITARLVLSHASGMPNWRPGRWTDDPQPLTIDFEPGSRFGYSGEGYEALRLAVERLTEIPVEEYLQKSVLRPLGMRHSSYVWQHAYEQTAATGHDREGEPTPKGKPREPNAASSLHTSAEDYARFLMAMMDDSAPQIVSLMTTRRTSIDEELGWGLGWGLERTESGEYFWHWGDNGSFKAFVMGSRSDRSAVVVFTNGESGLRACQAIVRAVLGSDHPALDFERLRY